MKEWQEERQERERLWEVIRSNRATGAMRDRFIELNRPLVRWFMFRHLRDITDPDLLSDLEQEGMVGVMQAFQNFKFSTYEEFSTYAFWWIRREILRCITRSERVIRVPYYFEEHLQSLERAKDRLRVQLFCEPTLEDLAVELRWPYEFVVEAEGVVTQRALLSLEMTVRNGGNNRIGETLADTIPDPDNPYDDPEEWTGDVSFRYAGKQYCADLKAALNTLSPSEREVVTAYFLGGTTYEKVGNNLPKPVTGERVRQIILRSCKKLRHYLLSQAHNPPRTKRRR